MTELEDVILTPRYAPRLRPTPIPSAGVFDAPAVCVLINRQWVGHLLGVLEALDQPDTWLGSSAEIDTARQNVRQLMVALILGNCDVTQFDIRLKPGSSCIIQKTLDGVNWIDAIDMSNCWKSGIRRNPATGDWGYYDGIDFYRFPDGAWIDDPSGLHIPSPKARSEGTDDQKRCDAAYGAALALQSLYRQTWDAFTKWTTLGVFWVTQQMMSMAEDLLGIGTSISVMGEYAEELYQQSPAFVEGGFPDSKLETCQNVLYCNSSVDAEGRVTFDSAAVQSEFGDLYASEGSPWGGLNFLITLFLGADGLNAAGNVDAGAGDCSGADCGDTWCYEWDFTLANGWEYETETTYQNAEFGAYQPGTGWIATNERTGSLSWSRIIHIKQSFVGLVTRIEFDYDLTKAGFAANSGLWDIRIDEVIVAGENADSVVSGSGTKHAEGDWNVSDRVSISMRSSYTNNGTYGGAATIKAVRIYGTGANPFGEDNC